jgi:hypothetical protein
MDRQSLSFPELKQPEGVIEVGTGQQHPFNPCSPNTFPREQGREGVDLNADIRRAV